MLAPIALFVYARPDHTRRTVEALLQNDHAGQSDLVVYSDAAHSFEQEDAVAAVRDYVSSITGFKSVVIRHRPQNYGLAKSIIDGVSEVVGIYGRVIVLEDDLVTSRHFLTYMNDGLERFADDERVISIHGYMYPVKRPLPEAFFLPGADCWGWATWSRGWALFNPDGQWLLDELQRRKLSQVFDFNGAYSFSGMLKGQVQGENDSWAVRWYASAFLAGKLTLYPGHSLVLNIGNDGSGSHCGTSSILDVQLSDVPIRLDGVEIQPSAVAMRSVEEFFKDKRSRLRAVLSHMNTVRVLTKLRAVAKDLFPPVVLHQLRRFMRGGICFEGDYASWDEASAQCTGYDEAHILDKVLYASLKVKRGVAAFERDSVLFDEIEYSWPVTAALMHVAARNRGRLYVLDFGGALGSAYFQNRKFLEGLNDVRWCVVEQGHYVDAGRKYIQDERLLFYPTVGNSVCSYKPDAVLLSSVLQYLEQPYAVIREVLASGPEIVIVDRVPLLIDPGPSVVKVQQVPSSIYSASYPCFFFNEKELFESFYEQGYLLLERFDALDKLDASAKWQGMIFTRKSDA